MRSLWDDGDMAIVQALGYETPNRSHFRGIDIWNTGSDSQEFLYNGWTGRLLANSEYQPIPLPLVF